MKTAFVTGGSGGIGSAVCRRLSADGFAVAIGFNTASDAAKALCAELRQQGTAAMTVGLDLSDPASVDKAYRTVCEGLAPPEVLVNNAGRAHIGLFADMSDSEIISLVNTDLTGAMLLSKRAAADMTRRHSGRIINISSVWGIAGASCEAAYSAAKAGLIGFTKALGKELAPSGVNVNCIAAGLIDTPMNASLSPEELSAVTESIPAGRAGRPEEIAALAAFLCSDEAAYINAQVITCDGGWL